MRARDLWQQQALTADSRAHLERLIDAQRLEPEDSGLIDGLLDAFLQTLSDAQMQAFARLLTEMTEQVH